jgi:hypothetical protein
MMKALGGKIVVISCSATPICFRAKTKDKQKHTLLHKLFHTIPEFHDHSVLKNSVNANCAIFSLHKCFHAGNATPAHFKAH